MTTPPTNTTVVHPLAFAKVVALQSCCDRRTIDRIVLVTVVVVVTAIIVASRLLWPSCGGCGSGGCGHHVCYARDGRRVRLGLMECKGGYLDAYLATAYAGTE